MKLALNKTVKYISVAHQGVGKIVRIIPTSRGPFYTVRDDQRFAFVNVRAGNLSAPK